MIDRQTLRRPWIEPAVSPGEKGTTRYVDIYVCNCAPGVQRGPLGGVCGNCAGAIPSASEAGMLLNLMRTRSLQIPTAPAIPAEPPPAPTKTANAPSAKYEHGVAVYFLEDNEQHHYVAKDIAAAIVCHFNEYNGDEDASSLSASYVPPERVLRRTEIGGLLDSYPDGFTIVDEDEHAPAVEAPAWRWAKLEAANAPVQLMSSVF